MKALYFAAIDLSRARACASEGRLKGKGEGPTGDLVCFSRLGVAEPAFCVVEAGDRGA